MKNIFLNNFFGYLFWFFCFCVLWQAGAYGLIFPFATGLCLALIWCGLKPYFLLPLYIVSALLFDFSIWQILGVVFFAGVIFLCTSLHGKLKKTITFPLFIFYGILAQCGMLFCQYFFFHETLFSTLTVVSAILFMWCAKTILAVFLGQNHQPKLSSLQIFCGLVCLGALASGLCAIGLFGVPLIFAFAPAIILIVSRAKKISYSVLVASVLGLGTTILDGSMALVAPFVVWSILAGVLVDLPKFWGAIFVVLSDALMGFGMGFYETYSTYHLAATALSATIFCLIPQKKLDLFCELFLVSGDLATKSIVNQNKHAICRRLAGLGEVFEEMDYIFRSMIKGGLTKEQAKYFLINEAKNKVCQGCPERNICHRKCHTETSGVFEALASIALEKGKISVLDAPAYLTTRCIKMPALTKTFNQLCAQYQHYANTQSNIDASRVLIADELKGVAGILKNLASEISHNISLDSTRETQIIRELTFNNIVCSSAMIYEENLATMRATLVVRKTDVSKTIIPKIVSKICKASMEICNLESSPQAGWSIVSLCTAPKFSAVFGTASLPKENSKVSGDAYSIIKLSHDKFLLALCDGMGSGEKAEKTSSLAIGLVENFYKAGFDNEIILPSINKLLSLNSEDIFSALDICVLDLGQGTADFIKMGAPESLIKRPNGTSIVSGGTLPLGIVQDAEPVIIKQIILKGDFVFMCTDGVSESFETDKNFQDFVNNLNSVNPQILAEKLIEQAVKNSGGARDDMTAIVVKIF